MKRHRTTKYFGQTLSNCENCYEFQIYHGQIYYLVWHSIQKRTILTLTGEKDWSTSAPDGYEYLARVKWLGDYTWIEVDDKGNPVDSTTQTSSDSDEQS